MNTASILCRVSSDTQEREGTSLDTQYQACLLKAKQLNWDVPLEYVIKEDWTGKDLNRPGLLKLLELARTKAISGIIIYTLDRLYRPDQPGDEWRVFEVLQRLKDYGVSVEWVDTSLPKNSPFSGIFMFLDSWRAGEERRKIAERTMRGKAARVAQGKFPAGMGPGIYGYEYVKETHERIINEYEARVVVRIFHDFISGDSLNKIAGELNRKSIPSKTSRKWHPESIGRMIRNPGYIGETSYKGILLPAVTPPIITKELFLKAQKIIERNISTRWGHGKYEYSLAGHIKCGFCGTTMTGTSTHGYRYYRCNATAGKVGSLATCRQAVVIRADLIEPIVWGKAKEVLRNPDLVLDRLREDSASKDDGFPVQEIARLEKKIEQYPEKKGRIADGYVDGAYNREAMAVRLSKLGLALKQDTEALIVLKSSADRMKLIKQAGKEIAKMALNLSGNPTLKEKRLILDSLGILVIATPDVLRIEGRYLPISPILQSSASLLNWAYSYSMAE